MFYRIKPHEESLLLRGKAPLESLPDRPLTMTMWNVWKAKKGDLFYDEFFFLKKQSDFLLLQEAHSRMFEHEDWSDLQTKMQVKMFSSFDYWWNSHSTGVMTLSRVTSADVYGIRFPERELRVLTPKSSLWSNYRNQNEKYNLTVLNLHFLNFVSWSTFERNFTWLIENMRTIKNGPLIVAGDLNTWTVDRLEFVHKKLATIGADPVLFDNDSRRLKLDHVFVRDIRVEHAEVLTQIKSSDHLPLQLTFRLK